MIQTNRGMKRSWIKNRDRIKGESNNPVITLTERIIRQASDAQRDALKIQPRSDIIVK